MLQDAVLPRVGGDVLELPKAAVDVLVKPRRDEAVPELVPHAVLDLLADVPVRADVRQAAHLVEHRILERELLQAVLDLGAHGRQAVEDQQDHDDGVQGLHDVHEQAHQGAAVRRDVGRRDERETDGEHRRHAPRRVHVVSLRVDKRRGVEGGGGEDAEQDQRDERLQHRLLPQEDDRQHEQELHDHDEHLVEGPLALVALVQEQVRAALLVRARHDVRVVHLIRVRRGLAVLVVAHVGVLARADWLVRLDQEVALDGQVDRDGGDEEGRGAHEDRVQVPIAALALDLGLQVVRACGQRRAREADAELLERLAERRVAHDDLERRAAHGQVRGDAGRQHHLDHEHGLLLLRRALLPRLGLVAVADGVWVQRARLASHPREQHKQDEGDDADGDVDDDGRDGGEHEREIEGDEAGQVTPDRLGLRHGGCVDGREEERHGLVEVAHNVELDHVSEVEPRAARE
mmetsp:Transcript_16958/g.59350  ORF Transcript_16958/g.59350 Transcript_16958/m.59350 type:complete len:461 (+) Transcript_16958:2468-3850(+)